ncbi:hypothetical protein MES5069_440005 [Mesorhizobium escarrei]|uniref:Transposase DDE domain-containing protein n=1 Tax=Mesorhizobium escarrei TaxID=666018 RepID=A0ABN8K2Y0_9HYPH|nr:hypothetical protein MES5069_440005 [Mesorhizobium escarrei]
MNPPEYRCSPLAYRELDDALGLTDMVGDELVDPRTGKSRQHEMTGLLRQSVFGRLGGYEDVNDADRLGRDPAMRWIVGGHAVARAAASSSLPATRTSPYWLICQGNGLTGCTPGIRQGHRARHGFQRQPDQEGAAYNEHFACTCYHPLFVFNQFGDLERSELRPGNVHSADGWRGVLDPVVERYRERDLRRYFRGDAAFAAPDIYEFLEAEGYKYTIRLKANVILQQSIAYLLTRPVGRPPNHVVRTYANFSYRAGSWDRKRRVVAKVEWHQASPIRPLASSSPT